MMFTAEEKHREAQREVEMRKTVYARTLMSPHEIKRKIAIMQEIADEYQKQAKERLL